MRRGLGEKIFKSGFDFSDAVNRERGLGKADRRGEKKRANYQPLKTRRTNLVKPVMPDAEHPANIFRVPGGQ